MTTRRFPLALIVLALLGGFAGFAVALAGSLILGVLTGLLRILVGRQPVAKSAPAWTLPVAPQMAMKR